MSEIEGTFALRNIQTGEYSHQKLLCAPHMAQIPEGYQLVQMLDGKWTPWSRPERLQLLDEIDEGLADLQGKVDELRAVLSD